jgi:uncharacterized protein (DUF2236 family)
MWTAERWRTWGPTWPRFKRLAQNRGSGSRSKHAPSYLDDRSMLRRVHRERVIALSGPRALLMQAAHPLAVAGVLAHSSALDEPYDRLARTAQVLHAIGFGSRAEANAAARRVRAMHQTVHGRLHRPVGRFPAGTEYRADDPELLMWVLFTLVDSGLVVYRTYVGGLSREDEAAYWNDYRTVGRLFGLRAGEMPRTLADLDDYRRSMLEGDTLVVTDWARERARAIVLEPPVPLAARPLVEAANFVTIALLPDRIREQYGFSPVPPAFVRKAVVRAGGVYVKRAVLPLLPARVRLAPV